MHPSHCGACGHRGCLLQVSKLAGLGWNGYTISLSNCFDGTVTLLSITVAFASINESETQRGMIRYVLALRLGRFGRLLGKLKEVRTVVATFVKMLPAAAKLLKVLFVALFFFSTIGMQLFGGLINYGPSYATLQSTSFGTANYYANNFNDLASGFVVCFELLVVNNWFVICGGFERVAFMPLVRLFFVAVYVFGVLVRRHGSHAVPTSLAPLHACRRSSLAACVPCVCVVQVCLNIVVAFALDSFNAVQEANAEADEPAEEEEVRVPDEGSSDAGAVLGRQHSPSIHEATRRFKPVLPVGLQGNASLKARLKAVNTPGRLLPHGEYTGSELAEPGGLDLAELGGAARGGTSAEGNTPRSCRL